MISKINANISLLVCTFIVLFACNKVKFSRFAANMSTLIYGTYFSKGVGRKRLFHKTWNVSKHSIIIKFSSSLPNFKSIANVSISNTSCSELRFA